MNIFNGDRPSLASTKARRSVDVEAAFEKDMPAECERRNALLDSGFKIVNEYFETSRGLSLGTRTFIPPEEVLDTANQTGIIFSHGHTDNVRWGTMRLMLTLAEQGFLVTAPEHEGHGFSDKVCGLMSDFDLVSDDLTDFIKEQQKKYPLKNWFLLGESMGGMIAIRSSIKAVEDKDIKLNGMVLVAPMCKIADTVKPNPLIIGVLLNLAKVFPTLSIVPTDMKEELCFKSKKIIEEQKKDPIKYTGRPRLATAANLLNSTIWLEKSMDKVTLPFLVIHGKKDVVTPYEGSQELYDKSTEISEKDKRIILPEDGWHGLLYSEPEEDMKSYWDAIFGWILERSE